MFTKWALATTVLGHGNCYTLKWNTFTFTAKARCVLPKSGALHFYNRRQPLLSVHMTFLFSISGLVWMDMFPPSSTGWKRSVFIPSPKKGNPKECSNYRTIALISHATKVMLKILQARLQQYMNCELPDVQAGFRKGRGTRYQIAKFRWIIEKARVPEKHLFLLYWLCQSLSLCGSQWTVENSERDGNTRPSDLPLEKPICRSGSNN